MKTVDITLDKERKMAFPLMSLVRLKKEFGIELKDLQDKEKSQDVETILAIIWAGLIHEDRELTYEDVGYMVDVSQLSEVSEKLTEVFGSVNAKNSQK
ncbi:hypothetical protein M4D68_00865 [Priestia aryabhattai]|uniref:hypothetical protein n=1 Tax=Priestia aryabhattai TaxID=412384 RepID=UPI002040DAA4|nr:hypothetical protein [Priestia aryabhattai]MCM3639696.1 hypothetical protein [Priestia aryabhattai]